MEKQKTEYEQKVHAEHIAKWDAKGWDAWYEPCAWGWVLCKVKRIYLPDGE